MYSGNEYDPKKADLFSLGVTLFVMATCCFPSHFAHETDKYYYYIVNKDFDAFWNMHESFTESKVLSESMKLLITTLLSPNPEQRPDFNTI